MAARAIPVFPEVGSMRTVSLSIFPLASRSSSMALAMRSLTDPAGLNISTLAKILPFKPKSLSMFLSSTNGVPPMVLSIES